MFPLQVVRATKNPFCDYCLLFGRKKRNICTITTRGHRYWLSNSRSVIKPVSYTHLDVYKRQGVLLTPHGTDFPYSAHLPDLTILYAYVWGTLKEPIFRENSPATIVELCEKIVTCVRRQQPLFTNIIDKLCEHYEWSV